VVHLHRLNLSGQVKCNNHARLDDASLHTADGYCSNSKFF
jgi:hypothetical protein